MPSNKAHDQLLARWKKDSKALFESTWSLNSESAHRKFWTCRLPEVIYDLPQSSLYDNRRVEPDWDKLDGSYRIENGQYFDLNGLRTPVIDYCDSKLLDTGEELPPGALPYLNKTACRCPWKVRKELTSMQALIAHLHIEHGSFMCYNCGSTFDDEGTMHGHLYRDHGFPAADFYCSHNCRKDFTSAAGLNYHLAGAPHSKKGVYRCQSLNCLHYSETVAEELAH